MRGRSSQFLGLTVDQRLVDRPTKLSCIWIFICQQTIIKDIAGQSNNQNFDHQVGSLSCLWLEDQFCLTFPTSLETATKATLLGAFFLIDFNYYWAHNQVNSRYQTKTKDHSLCDILATKAFFPADFNYYRATVKHVFSFLCQNIFLHWELVCTFSLTFFT